MDLKDITTEILTVAKDYQYHDTPSIVLLIQQWISRVLRILMDILSALKISLPEIADSRSVSSVIQFLLYLAGITAAFIFTYLVFGKIRQLETQKQRTQYGIASLESLLDSHAWKLEATRLKEERNWKSACRALYLSLLRLLDERGITPFAPAKTNFEYRYALDDKQQILQSFKLISDTVEETWFGNRHAQIEDFNLCWQELSQLEKVLSEQEPVVVLPR